DIYSLGCTFYYLLTGQPPFPGATLTEKLLKHQQAAPVSVEQFRKDVPPALAAVLRKMIGKRPEDRYQSPDEVVAALTPFLSPEGLPAASSSSSLEKSHWRRRVIVGGLVLLMGVVLLAIVFGKQAPEVLASSPALVIQCGKNLGQDEVITPGYNCRLNQGQRW